jgi:acetyltransferase-like isoleucine patch superfamily enzyme
MFKVLFSHSFKQFGKKAFIQSPDIIEGEEFISLEDNVNIGSMCWLLAHKQNDIEPILNISEGTTIGRFSHIVALQHITIEKNVLIADKVYISDNIHGYKDTTKAIKDQPIEFKKEVSIGENTWIGENVSIVGAKIGKHCIVGANSFVNSDIPDYSIAVGSPARVIKNIKQD